MKRYTAAQARQRFAELLDAAEQGEPVAIERKGVRFVVTVQRSSSRRGRRASLITYMDPAVAAGQWTWALGPDGLEFVPKRRRKT